MEEDDGYLTGETDPFIIEKSEGGMVVCPDEDRDDIDVFPPRNETVDSTAVFREDRLEMLLTGERETPSASDKTVDPVEVLKGRLESYKLCDIFGDAAGEGPGNLCDEKPLAAE